MESIVSPTVQNGDCDHQTTTVCCVDGDDVGHRYECVQLCCCLHCSEVSQCDSGSLTDAVCRLTVICH